MFFQFPDSSPSVLNGLHFYFSLRDSASREYNLRLCTQVTQASQGDLLGFVSSCREKEADHRDTTIFSPTTAA